MGWWAPSDNEQVVLGDEALDQTYGYLETLSALYATQLGRKPRVEELQYLLSLALQVCGDDRLLADFSTRRISAVTIRVGRRPRRQKYQVGDVCAIPLVAGRFAFGRIINLGDGWDLVEVFRYVATMPRFSPTIVDSGRLLPPLVVDAGEVFGGWLWRIVDSTPEYAPDLDYLELRDGDTGQLQANQGQCLQAGACTERC